MPELRRRRRIGPDIVERKRAAALVRPYLDKVGTWQTQLAFCRAQLEARRLARSDRMQLLKQLAEIRAAVDAAVVEMHRANEGQQVSGRIVDLMRSLERLDGSLSQLLH